MVSYIIPVYNGESCIGRCVQSIIDNTDMENDFEIVIVDDGSKDRTVAIIDRYAQAYSFVKAFHQTNKGPSAARNLGTERSSGEWLVFVDADDEITSDIAGILSDRHLTEYDWVVFSGFFVEERLIELSVHSDRNRVLTAILNLSEDLFLAKAHFNTVWSKAYKKEIIRKNKIKFEQRLYHGEDMLFNVDYMKKCGTVYCAALSVYTLCENENSVTHKFQKNSILNDMAFYKLLLNREIGKGDRAVKKVFDRAVLNGIWICLGQYFTHPQNSLNMKEKKRELKGFLEKEPYKTALKHYKCERKSYRRLIMLLLRLRLYFVVLAGFNFLRKPYCAKDTGSKPI